MSKPRSDRRRSRRAPSEGPAKPPEGVGAALEALPKWLPVPLLALATLLLFREFIFSGAMLFGSDTLSLGYMARAFFADALREGTFPLWNPIILGGTPFLESLAGGDSLHPLSVALLLAMETHRALGWKLVLHVFAAGLFMFGWLRVVGVSRGGALVGGLAFLLAPSMVTLAFPGHDGKIFVTAMTPLLFWMGEWHLRRGGLLPGALLALAIALVILSTHFQMAYFLFGGVGAYMIARSIQLARPRPSEREEGITPRTLGLRFAAFLGFSLLGAGVTAVQLVPAVDYVTEHSRRAATTLDAEGAAARAYSSSWSLHPEEAVSLVVPEFIGNSAGTTEWTTGTYWGRNPFKLNHEYLGLVALLLAGLGLLGGPARGIRWFMVGMGSVALLFALGTHTPVWRIFYEVVPGISLFRAPSMAIFLTAFSVATLAGFGVDRGARLVDEEKERPFLWLFGVAAGVLALGWVLAASGALGSLWTGILYSGIEAPKAEALERALPHIARGFGIALALTVGVAGLWMGATRRVLAPVLLVPGLLLLVAVDQGRVNGAFLEVMDYRAFAEPDQNHRFLMERQREEDPFRVLSFRQGAQDVTPGMHGLELAGGHHPNDLGRYRELIGMEGSGLPEHLARFNPNVLGILNIRYILWPDAEYGPLDAGLEPVSRLQFADGRVHSSVYRLGTLPRARIVGEAVVVAEGEEVRTILDENLYNPAHQVVLTQEPPIALSGAGGTARWIARDRNRLALEVEAEGPALLVVGDNWFPGWRARVDGEETPVLRADHTLRAVAVPGGRHEVEMWYASSLLRWSLFASLACLVLLTVLLFWEPVAARVRAGEAEGGREAGTGA